MANVQLTISAASAKEWRDLSSRLTFYAEEADIRIDTIDARPTYDDLGEVVGIRIKVPGPNVARLHEITTKANLVGLRLEVRAIPNDPDETAIQAKLYRGGDTSARPRDPTDRPRPSVHPRYATSEVENAEALKEAGRRARVDENGFPASGRGDSER